MAIKDILVHLDVSVATESRLDLAILYARKHGACLRGLYPITHAFSGKYDSDELSILERLKTLFCEKSAAAGIQSEWINQASAVIGVSISDIVTMHAYYSDLVIVGQTNHKKINLNVPVDLPEYLVKNCGRPVLVVPYVGSFNAAGERIMIAWKESRETIKSLNNAMPFIEMAHNVSIVGATAELNESFTDSPMISLCNYLSRHGVSCRTKPIFLGNLTIGDAILNNAYEQSADLLIMGASVPTSRKVFALSPIAKHVLGHLTIPVLLSH
jgi:nucleotide-binding universal stress UspA family protein